MIREWEECAAMLLYAKKRFGNIPCGSSKCWVGQKNLSCWEKNYVDRNVRARPIDVIVTMKLLVDRGSGAECGDGAKKRAQGKAAANESNVEHWANEKCISRNIVFHWFRVSSKYNIVYSIAFVTIICYRWKVAAQKFVQQRTASSHSARTIDIHICHTPTYIQPNFARYNRCSSAVESKRFKFRWMMPWIHPYNNSACALCR